jgi:hypothetical protein
MFDCYLLNLNTYLFLSIKKKSKYSHLFKPYINFSKINYKIKRSPISFSIKIYTLALLDPFIILFDRHKLQDLMYFIDAFLIYSNYNFLKFIF